MSEESWDIDNQILEGIRERMQELEEPGEDE